MAEDVPGLRIDWGGTYRGPFSNRLPNPPVQLSLDELNRSIQRLTICVLCGLTVYDEQPAVAVGDRIRHVRCSL